MQVEFIAQRQFILNGQPVAPGDRVDVATVPNPLVRALAGARKLALRVDGRPATPGEMALLLHPPGRAGQLSQPPAANATPVPTLEPAPQPAPKPKRPAQPKPKPKARSPKPRPRRAMAAAAAPAAPGRAPEQPAASPPAPAEPLSTAPNTAPAGPKSGSKLESLARSERRRRQKARTRQAAVLADALFTPRSRAERARALVAALPSLDPPEGTPS